MLSDILVSQNYLRYNPIIINNFDMKIVEKSKESLDWKIESVAHLCDKILKKGFLDG